MAPDFRAFPGSTESGRGGLVQSKFIDAPKPPSPEEDYVQQMMKANAQKSNVGFGSTSTGLSQAD